MLFRSEQVEKALTLAKAAAAQDSYAAAVLLAGYEKDKVYLLNVGSSRIGELLDYLGVKTVTGTTWESGTINGMLCNEKYKGDFHLQKYYTPENKRNHTRKNNGEVQSHWIFFL